MGRANAFECQRMGFILHSSFYHYWGVMLTYKFFRQDFFVSKYPEESKMNNKNSGSYLCRECIKKNILKDGNPLFVLYFQAVISQMM